MKLIRKDALVAIIAGLIIALAGTYLLGFISAIAPPFKTTSSIMFYLWDIVVVQLLGIDLLAGLVSFIVIKQCRSSWTLLCAFIFLAVEFYLYWVVPVAHSEKDALFALNLESYYADLLILVYIFLGGFLARKY